jgi:ADP-ribosyl-[dinitrogen reductase] hydrolase
VPGIEFEQQWTKLGPLLRSQLKCGFNIVVHCKGGLGRAGTIASRLLIDAGTAPAEALAAVRAARPGAVETVAQDQYVLGLTPVPYAMPSTTREAIEDRAVGAFLGLAVGDGLGTTLEFTRRDARPRVTDLVGGGPFGLMPGEWTDDTAMALALADSLAANPSLDAADLMNRFVDWFRRGTTSCTGRCFDIGGTTRAALTSYERTGDPIAGATDPFSAGNGSLMRLAPVALRHWNDRERLTDVAVRQSLTTHGAPEAVSSCLAFAHLLADAIEGRPRDEVLRPRELEVATKVAKVIGGSWAGKERHEISSSGYVIDSLEAALWCVARTASFADAVILAANLGDDADTVAAITGQLAGALYGASAIPSQWMAKLAWRERLEAAAGALVR